MNELGYGRRRGEGEERTGVLERTAYTYAERTTELPEKRWNEGGGAEKEW